MTFSPAEIERLIHHMPAVIAHAETAWERGFAQSVLKQSKRRNWRPSTKQLPVMRGLVDGLFGYGKQEGGFDVIE